MSTLADAGIAPLVDLPYPEQLVLRQARVERALGRVGVPVQPMVPSPLQSGSRARVKLRGGPGGLGFHLPGSHDLWIVPPDELARIARPEVVAMVTRLADCGIDGEVEVCSNGERVVCVLEKHAPVPKDVDASVGKKRKSGDPVLFVDGLRVSPTSFLQVNLEVNRLVVAYVDAILERAKPARILDLYGGVGNLSARANARGTPVTLVEREGSATGDAGKNLPGAQILDLDAGRWKPGQTFYDVAILDPPRAGAPGVIERLTVTRPRLILYLSCDPGTLARDLGTLPKGYAVTALQPFDMFPGTEHVETLAIIERG